MALCVCVCGAYVLCVYCGCSVVYVCIMYMCCVYVAYVCHVHVLCVQYVCVWCVMHYLLLLSRVTPHCPFYARCPDSSETLSPTRSQISKNTCEKPFLFHCLLRCSQTAGITCFVENQGRGMAIKNSVCVWKPNSFSQTWEDKRG